MARRRKVKMFPKFEIVPINISYSMDMFDFSRLGRKYKKRVRIRR